MLASSFSDATSIPTEHCVRDDHQQRRGRAYRCLRNTVVAVDTFGGFDSFGAPAPS